MEAKELDIYMRERAEIREAWEVWKTHNDRPARYHESAHVFNEHGQWWVNCTCGCAWSVVETSNGLDFEQVSGEDELYCEMTAYIHECEDEAERVSQ